MTETPASPEPSEETPGEDERHHADVERNIPDAADEAAAEGTLTADDDSADPDVVGLEEELAAAEQSPRTHQEDLQAFEQAVPFGIRVAAGWTWRLILLGVGIYAFGRLLGHFSEVTIPVAVALLLTALMQPLINRLTRWGVPRGLSVAIGVVGGLLVVLGVLALIVWQIVNASDELASQSVAGVQKLLDWINNGPLKIDTGQVDGWLDQATEWAKKSSSVIAAYAASAGATVGHFFAGLAIALFALFFFLYDGRAIWSFLLRFSPKRARPRIDLAARTGWKSLVAYVRATVLVALVDAIGVLIVALILQIQLAPALAALVFLGAFVPIVGALVTGFVAVAVALVTLGWVQALIMLGGIIVVMQVEGHVLQPFLLGKAVHIHPLAVILGIAIGITIAGIVGGLIAIPVMAFAKTFVSALSSGAVEKELGRLQTDLVAP